MKDDMEYHWWRVKRGFKGVMEALFTLLVTIVWLGVIFLLLGSAFGGI